MTIIWKAALALFLLGATTIAGWHYATVWQPSAKLYPLQGIDLGAEPREIEWGFVRAAGADFAYLTATEGADRRVPSFEENWNALPGAGLRRGAVHVYSLCQPAVAQANAFNTVVPRLSDALPAALDIDFHEDCAARPEPADLIRDVRLFLKMVEAHTGKPVLLRVGKAMEGAYSLSATIHRPVWAMANFMKPDYAARPWRMWRASNVRRIEGVDGPVNWDVTAS